MMCLLRLLASALAVLLLFAAQPVAAQAPSVSATETSVDEQEGRARFQAGRAAFSAGRFDDALDDFQRAYRLTKNPVLLFNIGAAADHLRKDEIALEAFAAYLTRVPDATNRAEVEGRVRVLRERPAAQTKREPPPAPPSEPRATPAPSPKIEAPAFARGAAAPQPDLAPLATSPSARARTTHGAWPWVLTGIGGALAVSGVVVLALGLQDKAKVEDAPRDTKYSSVRDARERAPTRIGVGAAFMGIGVVAATAGLIWHFRAKRVTPGLEVGAKSAHFALRGSF